MNRNETTAFRIRVNLVSFGLKDLQVVGKIDVTDDSWGPVLRTVETRRMPLSELCAHSSDICRLGVKLNREAGEKVDFDIRVLSGGKEIGTVDCDGQFNYAAAPDLRTCVGWAVCTDYGREEVLLDYDLDAEVARLVTATQALGRGEGLEESFFDGGFARAIKQVMAYGKGSRFGDGHCGVKALFWQCAVRQVHGEEHPGFDFAY